MPGNLSEVRKRAWATRRVKYGERGHAGTYARPISCDCSGLLSLVIRMHVEGALSEGQVAKASGLGRVQIRQLADEHNMRTGDRAHAG